MSSGHGNVGHQLHTAGVEHKEGKQQSRLCATNLEMGLVGVDLPIERY